MTDLRSKLERAEEHIADLEARSETKRAQEQQWCSLVAMLCEREGGMLQIDRFTQQRFYINEDRTNITAVVDIRTGDLIVKVEVRE